MSAQAVRAAAPGAGARSTRRTRLRAFLALCERDAWVTVRHDAAPFLAQALLQPLFFLFVLGRVLPEIGAAQGAYGSQLMPGIMSLTLTLTALQNTALPLVIEFSFTKEIEDRLLAPLPVYAVAVQKMVIAAARGMIAGVNPLTYVSEGLRASLTTLPHLHEWAIALGLVASLAVFGTLGTRLFVRRAVD